MKWITRERARVDRIACPWLIRRFIDPRAEIHWVPGTDVRSIADELEGIPFDVPAVDYGHHGDQCSFDAFLPRHGLANDEALTRLATIIRGADTGRPELAPESAGLAAMANGFWAMGLPDEESLRLQSPLYDALYMHCGGDPP
ncbi:MAG: chromate resistance protein [Chloroflexi bacterium]|nr:chromate resistance protein [Chloroflexota bacterium]